MEHKELEQLTSTLMSEISVEQLEQGLTMPVEAKVTDLEINCNQIKDDAAHFERFGFDWLGMTNTIQAAATALRSAEVLFTAEEKIAEDSEILWRDNRDDLYGWRSEAAARLTHLASTTQNTSLFESLRIIGSADGHQDAIQDAHTVTHLVDEHAEALAANRLSPDRVAEAKTVLDICTKAYPKVLNKERNISPAKELRDRAFWYLVKLERQLKEIDLPLVFFDDYDRRREYGSFYKRDMRKKK